MQLGLVLLCCTLVVLFRAVIRSSGRETILRTCEARPVLTAGDGRGARFLCLFICLFVVVVVDEYTQK